MGQTEEHNRNVRVLIVEDNVNQLRTLVDIVEIEDFPVVACSTAKEALALAHQERFGIVIMDLRLPDTDGVRLLEQLRALDSIQRIIINTGFASLDSAKEAVNLGAFAYVEKAGDPEELVRHVHRAHAAYLSLYAKELESVVADRTMALHRSESDYRILIEQSADGIFISDKQGNFTLVNAEAGRMLGYTRDELERMNVRELVVPEVVPNIAPWLEELGRGAPLSIECQLRCKDGAEKIVEVQACMLSDGRIQSNLRDITERKRMEEALGANESRFRAIFEQAAVGMSHVGLDGRFLLVNQKLCYILGYTQEELLRLSCQALTHPDDLEVELRQIERVFRGELQEFSLEKRHLRKDGSLVWVHMTSSLICEADETPLYFVDVIEDISVRKQIEAEQQRLVAILENTSDFVTTTTIDGRGVYLNGAGRALIGLAPDSDLSSWPGIAAYSPSSEELMRTQAIPTALRAGLWAGEAVAVSHRGEEIPISQVLIAHKGENGRVQYLSVLARDISEQKRVEEMLQALPRQLLAVQEHERRQIAHELHDEIGQVLTAIKINLQTIQRTPEVFAGRMEDSVHLVENALQQVRTLSLDLRPPMLDDLGLVVALRWHLDQHAQRTGLSIQFEADFVSIHPPQEIAIVCFRIVQEALTNIVRHAYARQVQVELRQDNAALHLRVWNDGETFDVNKARARARRGESTGLVGMQERAQMVGGRVDIVSRKGQGTEVHVWLPLPIAEAHAVMSNGE
jgi:PAS domain S-box-containing protein